MFSRLIVIGEIVFFFGELICAVYSVILNWNRNNQNWPKRTRVLHSVVGTAAMACRVNYSGRSFVL